MSGWNWWPRVVFWGLSGETSVCMYGVSVYAFI